MQTQFAMTKKLIYVTHNLHLEPSVFGFWTETCARVIWTIFVCPGGFYYTTNRGSPPAELRALFFPGTVPYVSFCRVEIPQDNDTMYVFVPSFELFTAGTATAIEQTLPTRCLSDARHVRCKSPDKRCVTSFRWHQSLAEFFRFAFNY